MAQWAFYRIVAMALRAKLVNTIDGLEEIRPGWQRLVESLPDNTLLFTSWDYVTTYLTVNQPRGWIVVVFYADDSDTPVAVYPLSIFNVEHEGRTFRLCRPLGVPFAPYLEFAVLGHIASPITQSLLYEVLSSHLGIEMAILGPLRYTSPTYIGILETVAPADRKVLNLTSYVQIDPTTQSLDAYVKGRRYSTFTDAARCERRFREAGIYECRTPDNGDDVHDALAQLFEMNRDKFGDRHAYQRHGDWPRFLTALYDRLRPSGQAEISTLRLDGRIAAAALSFIHKGRFYYYMSSYDPSLARLSPSKVLMRHLIERAFTNKQVFCFGGGIYSYKNDWAQSIGEARIPAIFFSGEVKVRLEPILTIEKLGEFIGHR